MFPFLYGFPCSLYILSIFYLVKIIIPGIVIMAAVYSTVAEHEPIKIELPKKVNKTDRSYNPKNVDYNNRLDVSSDLNGMISSTPPNGYFMDALKNRMDAYFREPTVPRTPPSGEVIKF